MRGTIESADEPAALALLAGMGLQDVSLTLARTPVLRRPLGADDFIFFNEQLAALASSGIALEQGLRHLAKDIDSPRLRHTIDAVAANLERGAPLDEAVARESGKLPPLYGRVIRAGLSGGHLSSTLLNLSNHLRFLTHTRRLIVQALAYPGMVCLLAGGILCAILIWVVPSFEEIYKDFDVQLPRITWLLILLSHYVPQILIGFGVVAAAVVLFYLMTLGTAGGRALRERVVVGLPLVGRLVLDSLRARFLRGLAHGVQSGLPLPEALRLSAEAMGSAAGLSEAEAVARVVESGGTVMDATRTTKFVPPILGYVLQVCATPADAEQALIQLAEGYSSRAEHAQLVLCTWLPPAAIFVVGAFIALSILGIFLPLVRLVESVSG